MNNRMDEFKGDINWKVFNDQQKTPVPLSMRGQEEGENADIPLHGGGRVSTMFGMMPSEIPALHPGTPESRSLIDEMINAGGATPGVNIIGQGARAARPLVEKGIEYMQPGKAAEEFRSTIGSGTSAENIGELSMRAQLARGSREQEALIPKEELYMHEGRSDVYRIPESSLPEGNAEKLSHMIAPGEKNIADKNSELIKAVKDYRLGKIDNEIGGKPIDTFLERAENIFNIPELTEASASKIEDVLSMPVKRGSRYFSDREVASAYSPKGKLMQLHEKYLKKPTMNNYDELQSEINTELRKLKKSAETSDTASLKYEQMKLNKENLNADKEAFMKTLPEKMQNLENEFREKYRNFAETYKKGSAETGASKTLRRLAEGRSQLVSDQDVVNLFSHPTAADKRAILDLGPSAARNAIYSALQKVPHGDAKKMAETILDLKRTKGFDNIVTKEMEVWARNMITRTGRVEKIKGISSAIPTALAGYGIGGLPGMVAGAALPKGVQYIRKMMHK